MIKYYVHFFDWLWAGKNNLISKLEGIYERDDIRDSKDIVDGKFYDRSNDLKHYYLTKIAWRASDGTIDYYGVALQRTRSLI